MLRETPTLDWLATQAAKAATAQAVQAQDFEPTSSSKSVVQVLDRPVI